MCKLSSKLITVKVIIVEDELAASDNLTYLLQELDSGIEVIKVLDSIRAAVSYFTGGTEAELVFMDIHLADGISFDIFDQVSINIPIIFTTAYDQYALKAFKLNSIDYLLKPIDDEELTGALKKFKNLPKITDASTLQMGALLDLIKNQGSNYKTTYLVHQRDEMIPVKTESISYFYIETGIVKGVTMENKSYVIDQKLEDIESELNPNQFIRINRQFILQKNAVANIKYYFNGKLIVNTNPPTKDRIIVSKAKATEFKKWVNS